MREPNAAVVHFYRASVMHADVWRRRLDATTNWAVVSTAALITFTFSSTSNPHFILLLALAFDAFFLFMESRRYQVFDLWRHRIRSLNRWIMAPHISPRSAPPVDEMEDGLERLAISLSSTRPILGIWHALGYRMRRNYMFVFMVVISTWLLKLWYHPEPAGLAGTLIARASVGLVPGAMIMSVVFGFFAFCLVLTLRAPGEVMEEWSDLGSPVQRMLNGKPVLRTMEPGSNFFVDPLEDVLIDSRSEVDVDAPEDATESDAPEDATEPAQPRPDVNVDAPEDATEPIHSPSDVIVDASEDDDSVPELREAEPGDPGGRRTTESDDSVEESRAVEPG